MLKRTYTSHSHDQARFFCFLYPLCDNDKAMYCSLPQIMWFAEIDRALPSFLRAGHPNSASSGRHKGCGSRGDGRLRWRRNAVSQPWICPGVVPCVPRTDGGWGPNHEQSTFSQKVEQVSQVAVMDDGVSHEVRTRKRRKSKSCSTLQKLK